MLASAHFNGPYKNNWGGEKNFTIAISANWSGMQLFPPIHLPIQKKKFSSLGVSQHKPRHTWDQGTLRCHKPECGAKKRPQMLQDQRSFTCTLKQRHMYSTVVRSLFSPTSLFARAIFFDQKHFLRICCPPSDDFQTTPVIWWTDGSQSWICLAKAFVLVWAQWTLRPEGLPGRHMWAEIKPQKEEAAVPDIIWKRKFTLSSIILRPICGQWQSFKVKVYVF